MPIVRDKDGLAMSSRNVYLNEKERKEAVILSVALKHARGLIKEGITDSGKIITEIRRLINTKNNARIDYISTVHPDTLEPLSKIKGRCLIALAAWLGKTRLIDNIIITKA